MDIQEGDFTKENLERGVVKINSLIVDLIASVINNYGGPGAENILKGTLCKFVSRLNLFLINIKVFLDFIESPGEVFNLMGKDLSYTPGEISRISYIISRFDFFIGIFSLFEDAVSNTLEKHLFTIEEIKGMQFNKNTGKYSDFIPFETIISKLRKNNIITIEEENILLGCKNIRNTMHNNGSTKKVCKIIMLNETFQIKEKETPSFITLERVVKWVEELVVIFIKIAKTTDWKNIKDSAIK